MIVQLSNVSKRYGNNNPVLDNISLEISEGSSIAITGPSGSGKSTLLNIMGTLDFPNSGMVSINGKSVANFSEPELTELRNKKIGFVFQSHLLLPQLTVIENILLPVIPREKEFQKQAPEKALQLLNIVGMSGKINSFPGEMSVGECQRVAVVRSLINEPELVLADEPTGSLDHDSAETLTGMLLKLHELKKFTLVVVTHSTDLSKRMKSAYKLINGKILAN